MQFSTSMNKILMGTLAFSGVAGTAEIRAAFLFLVGDLRTASGL